MPESERLLDIGCGPTGAQFEGYRVVGIDRAGGDIRADVRALPFQARSFAYGYASHILEHLPPENLLSALSEWHRILAPGGLLWLRVPNLDWALDRIRERGLDNLSLCLLYGSHWGVEDSSYQVHRTGFTLASLAQLISHAPEWELVGLEAEGDSIWPGEAPGQEIHAFLRARE